MCKCDKDKGVQDAVDIMRSSISNDIKNISHNILLDLGDESLEYMRGKRDKLEEVYRMMRNTGLNDYGTNWSKE